MKKNWKTTSAGIIMIVGGIVRMFFAFKNGNITEESILTATTAVLGGIGLVFAKDSNVTGGNTQQ
jgi:uncharacterized membrane protein HdeD (DUF308 family)